MIRRTLVISGLLVALAVVAHADEAETSAESEIEFLISAIGASGCDFVRNGKRHSARDAEEHIRTKYRRGRRYAPTTELFIERLASRSSMSKKPYRIECPGEPAVTSGDWLKARLEEHRGTERD